MYNIVLYWFHHKGYYWEVYLDGEALEKNEKKNVLSMNNISIVYNWEGLWITWDRLTLPWRLSVCSWSMKRVPLVQKFIVHCKLSFIYWDSLLISFRHCSHWQTHLRFFWTAKITRNMLFGKTERDHLWRYGTLKCISKRISPNASSVCNGSDGSTQVAWRIFLGILSLHYFVCLYFTWTAIILNVGFYHLHITGSTDSNSGLSD